MEQSKLDELVDAITTRIADLEDGLLSNLRNRIDDLSVAQYLVTLYELRSHLTWGGQVAPAESVVVSMDNIQQLESLMNDVTLAIERQRNNAK